MRRGVGYAPPPGSASSYVLDNVDNAPLSHPMDLSALPADGETWQDTPADREAYERRYGAGSWPISGPGAPSRFKKWGRAPQNELGFEARSGLEWAFRKAPRDGYDGVATDLEIKDAQATGWAATEAAEEIKERDPAGFREGNPEHVSRFDKPHGPFTEPNPWVPGGVEYFYNDANLAAQTSAPTPPVAPPAPAPHEPPPHAADPETLTLHGGRFAVTARYQAGALAGSAKAQAIIGPADNTTGALWFFAAANLEVFVKIIDAGPAGWWVFAAGLTDVAVELTVTDTKTGAVKTYSNPAGTAYQPVQDTSAFPAG